MEEVDLVTLLSPSQDGVCVFVCVHVVAAAVVRLLCVVAAGSAALRSPLFDASSTVPTPITSRTVLDASYGTAFVSVRWLGCA